MNIEVEGLKDFGIDITKPEDIASFMQQVIKESSKPTFASDASQEFDKFIQDGGDGKAYFQVKYGNPLDYSKLDPEDLTDTVKEKIVRDVLTIQNPKKDSKFIETKLKRIKDSGTLDDEAKEGLETLAEKQENDNKTLENDVKKSKQKEIEESETYIENIKKTINESDNIAGIPINKSAKQKFFNFLTVANKRTGLTSYEQAIKNDPEASIKMAYFLHKNFNFKDIEKKAETETAKKVRKGLEGFQKKASGKSLKNKKTKEEIQDDNEVDFSLLDLNNMMG